MLTRSGKSRHITMPNIVKTYQSVAKKIRFFDFSRWRCHLLDCRIYKKKLLADGVWRAQTHHCTKFCQNRSFSCGDIVIFRIFKMAAVSMLDFWNRKILLANGVQRIETYQHVKFRQFDPLSGLRYQPKPKKAHPCVSPRHFEPLSVNI